MALFWSLSKSFPEKSVISLQIKTKSNHLKKLKSSGHNYDLQLFSQINSLLLILRKSIYRTFYHPFNWFPKYIFSQNNTMYLYCKFSPENTIITYFLSMTLFWNTNCPRNMKICVQQKVHIMNAHTHTRTHVSIWLKWGHCHCPWLRTPLLCVLTFAFVSNKTYRSFVHTYKPG